MGKKSRLKGERRLKQSRKLDLAPDIEKQREKLIRNKREKCFSSLSKLLSNYNAIDVAIALNISDLWLPNISSQVKHHFAFRVFASISSDQFFSSNKIDSYEKFVNFSHQIITIIPNLPMLEDFIPEADWGEISIESKDRRLKVFYGGNVERLTDFIEAFRLEYGGIPRAIHDMHYVLNIQNHIISGINKEIVGKIDELEPGHIETPSDSFFNCQRSLFLSIDESMNAEEGITIPSHNLMVSMGELELPANLYDFGNSVLSGSSLPAISININGTIIPLSIRNSASVVIDYWAQNIDVEVPDTNIASSVSAFLSKRFERIVNGPFQLGTRYKKLPYIFSSVVETNSKILFLMHLTVMDAGELDTAEAKISELLSREEEWALIHCETSRIMVLRDPNGVQPAMDKISIMGYLSGTSTTTYSIPLPKTNIRIMSLPDMFSVFDSLENIDEIGDFLEYINKNRSRMMPMGGGITDQFASFRDSSSVLIDGAIEPDMITLNPHWGSNWRYNELVEYWRDAPAYFPDRTTQWSVKSHYDGITSLHSKGAPRLSWCTSLGSCTLHFVFDINNQIKLDSLNGRLLELFVECIADAMSQRREYIDDLPIFSKKCIVLDCRAVESLLATEPYDKKTTDNSGSPIFSNFVQTVSSNDSVAMFKTNVNLARVLYQLDGVKDASFQAECAISLTEELMLSFGYNLNPVIKSKLENSSSRKSRVMLTHTERTIDVPDICFPEKIKPEHYKIGRKKLAVIFRDLEVQPGRYELTRGKVIIDLARNKYRDIIHEMISEFDKKSLLRVGVQQHDTLSSKYQNTNIRLNQSLNHEVVYNIPDALSEAHAEFTKSSRNYRYLIEVCLSNKTEGQKVATSSLAAEVIGYIDWLLVLYTASDILHNEIDVGGIHLDHNFVPEVFYSEGRNEKEKEFSLEVASMNLGIDTLSQDEVNSGSIDHELNNLFFDEMGFSYSGLKQVLAILTRWHSFGGCEKLSFSYQARYHEIIDVVLTCFPDLERDSVYLTLKFLTLRADSVRTLLGRDVETMDTPIWEHTKRGSRYTIKPLIPISDDIVMWGACASNQTLNIWGSSVNNGYLPADYKWTYIKPAIRNIKERLEKNLEKKAFDICLRSTKYVLHGIDFKRRFPKENFPDVGDFDVLAYWPTLNTWLTVECKYNQPPYCLKDGRRLKDKIFGYGDKKGQLGKIERRSSFLSENLGQLRILLDWPSPTDSESPSPIVTDLYVSRDIYWWMRYPPLSTSIKFIRIDMLDGWLKKTGHIKV